MLVAAPNLAWQITHDWPQLTVAEGISSDEGTENRILFVPMQLVQLSLFLVPAWVVGLIALWRSPSLRWARPMAAAYPLLCVLVVLIGGKPYYTLPLLLVLVAAGCTTLATWAHRPGRRRLLAAGISATVVSSAVIALPVLPSEDLDVVNTVNAEQGEQVGWPRLVETVGRG